ncbi:hypothetical protein C8R43DRAFT_1124814 [Mycena crocata]|nr:hypothetical protein C8R43DRAFT_1124814 [Mycena crocata]
MYSPINGSRGPLSSLQPTLYNFPSGALTPNSSEDSILGRHMRTDSGAGDLAEWSRPTKVLLKNFATSTAGEYSVDGEKIQQFVEASTLPTQKLLIVLLATVIGTKQDSLEDMLQAYLVSPGFKENVIGKLCSVLLDPILSSYKQGFLYRLLHHIRLNPGTYRIPIHLRPYITSRAFKTALSAESTAARSELKRKMSDHAKKGSDIAVLGKALVWDHTQEPSDPFWGRFAWLQFFLLEYSAKPASNARGFWDAVDKALADRREENLTYPAEIQDEKNSFIFEVALQEHTRKYPIKLKSGNKKRASQQMPPWQLAISRAVNGMEGYTVEQLAGEDEEEEDGAQSQSQAVYTD